MARRRFASGKGCTRFHCRRCGPSETDRPPRKGRGIIGAEACAKAAPDGYTVCAVYHSIMSFNPFTFEKLPCDPERDFVPVTNLFFVIEGLVVPVGSVAELRAYAAKNPAAVKLGTLGEGSLQELFLAWLNREWGTSIAGIPYKGGGPIATALLGGEIQIGQMGLGNFIGQIQGGKLRALAISASRRSRLLSQVPTSAEAGLGGFAARVWWGLVLPAGTPAQVVAKLNADFLQVFREKAFGEFMEERYVEPALGTPREFAAFLRADREAARALVKLGGQAKRWRSAQGRWLVCAELFRPYSAKGSHSPGRRSPHT